MKTKLTKLIGIAVATLAMMTLLAGTGRAQSVAQLNVSSNLFLIQSNATGVASNGVPWTIPPNKDLVIMPSLISAPGALTGTSNVVYSFNLLPGGANNTNWTTTFPVSLTVAANAANLVNSPVWLSKTNFYGFSQLRLDKIATTQLTNIWTTNMFILWGP